MKRGLALRLIRVAFTPAEWLLVGCAAPQWSHPTAGEPQFKVDDSQCWDQAARSMGVGYPRRGADIAA